LPYPECPEIPHFDPALWMDEASENFKEGKREKTFL
jgi:hypothetical protein